MTYNYLDILNGLESGSYSLIDTAPAIMALLDYEVMPHGRLGFACRPIGEGGNWQSIPNFNSADDFELWVAARHGGKLCDIGKEEDGRWYVSYEDAHHGNDYGYGRRMGTAMWAAFIALAGEVERPE